MNASLHPPDHPSVEDTAVIGRRVVQFIIDYFVVGIVAGGALSLFLLSETDDDGGLVVNARFWTIAIGFVVVAVGWAVWVWVWRPARSGGQTYGMTWLGLRVRRLDGQPVTAGTMTIRWLLLIVDAQISGLVGLLFMAFTERNQRLGDLAAGTVVTRA